jgi:hypothetical protein
VSWCVFISHLLHTGFGEHAKFCFSNKQTVPTLEMLYVKILKQTLVLIKSKYGIARLGPGSLGMNIKAMSAQLVGCCKSW